VVGRFEGDVGTFECDDVWEGTPIRVRYRWTKTDPDHPRWEQAFTADAGQTWETNWKRTSAAPDPASPAAPAAGDRGGIPAGR
jgi:hypothetical protein